jgi:hypothetical protein
MGKPPEPEREMRKLQGFRMQAECRIPSFRMHAAFECRQNAAFIIIIINKFIYTTKIDRAINTINYEIVNLTTKFIYIRINFIKFY